MWRIPRRCRALLTMLGTPESRGRQAHAAAVLDRLCVGSRSDVIDALIYRRWQPWPRVATLTRRR